MLDLQLERQLVEQVLGFSPDLFLVVKVGELFCVVEAYDDFLARFLVVLKFELNLRLLQEAFGFHQFQLALLECFHALV